MTKILIILTLFIGANLNAQQIFPEKFEDCKAAAFRLESDSMIAKITDKEFIDIISSGFTHKIKRKIEGSIALQIFVDLEGNSCLLSVDNKTNFSTSKLNLKRTIDDKLHWRKLKENISAIIVLKFQDNLVSLKRLGNNANAGWYEITDNGINLQSLPKIKKNENTKNNPFVRIDSKTNSQWKLYTTDNSVIPFDMSRSVKIDRNGNIWYCTDEGIVKIVGEKWIVMTAENTPLPKNKFGKTITTSLAIDNLNRVWIESYGNVIMFDSVNWIKYDTTNSPLKSVQKISIDKNGVIWFGTFKGLIKYDGKDWKIYNTQNSKIPSNNVRNVFLDKYGKLWIATANGIAILDNSDWTIYNTVNSSLPCNNISCIQGDESGNIWIGTNEVKEKGGLVKIDNENKWTVYTKENSKLPTNTIWDIELENNIIWLGFHEGGLGRFDGINWEIYNKFNSIIPNDYVCSIAIDKNGNKWVATFGGLVFTTR